MKNNMFGRKYHISRTRSYQPHSIGIKVDRLLHEVEEGFTGLFCFHLMQFDSKLAIFDDFAEFGGGEAGVAFIGAAPVLR